MREKGRKLKNKQSLLFDTYLGPLWLVSLSIFLVILVYKGYRGTLPNYCDGGPDYQPFWCSRGLPVSRDDDRADP